MKKQKEILLVTIQSQNYGNRLQNYALQEYLVSQGYQVKSLNEQLLNRQEQVKRYVKFKIDQFGLLPNKNYRWEAFDRKIHFEKNQEKKYDCYIAGSDQIWNPFFHFNSDREFLTFAPQDKRIAYAGSIGLDKLPENQLLRYRKNFNEFATISCRETAGAEIISNLTQKVTPVVVDPTMLLDKNEWKKLIKESRIKPEDKFIVKYFLGSKNKNFDLEIELYAKENNYKVIDIFDVTAFQSKIGPIEFVWLLANSEYNFVDSFHGAVFSILFEKDFIVFDRPAEQGTGKMSSRIETLLTTYNLNHLLLNEKDKLNIVSGLIDYDYVETVLEERRNASITYLLNSIQEVM